MTTSAKKKVGERMSLGISFGINLLIIVFLWETLNTAMKNASEASLELAWIAWIASCGIIIIVMGVFIWYEIDLTIDNLSSKIAEKIGK